MLASLVQNARLQQHIALYSKALSIRDAASSLVQQLNASKGK